MKVERISEHIWSLKTWMFIPIHVWLVVDEDGVTLVDGGMPRMEQGIKKAIEQLNKGSLKQILLTHGHSDHTGAVPGIVKKYDVPVYAHQIEIPFMEGDSLYPRRKKLEKNLPKNIAKPLKKDEKDNLLSLSGLTPYLTPGHAPGHVVYYHEQDQVLLAGDLFTSKRGMLRPPMKMFTADMEQAIKSASILSKLNPVRMEVCHGAAVLYPAKQLTEYVMKYGINEQSQVL